MIVFRNSITHYTFRYVRQYINIEGVTITTAVLVIFLIKWNSNLNKEVKKWTKELESANEQLKVKDKIQKEFINVVSHEIKTPTQAIIGYTELLQSDPHKPDLEAFLGLNIYDKLYVWTQ